ncbi:TRAF-type zinc finger domain-containing protein 1 [Camellia lanceoleosa]|uniref:TRAF-type zinc finger domain-containing protein 1 n=1 Tax=Camellia lanceoleosa TaxID=1840588 RepID=A0ACC0HIB5_9ERIC|nr:TRAF-type zinc finger domain-containing protein 1 [Camellia lanceoleosa]
MNHIRSDDLYIIVYVSLSVSSLSFPKPPSLKLFTPPKHRSLSLHPNQHSQSLPQSKETFDSAKLSSLQMAIASDQATSSICSHCDRAIPSSNIDLHYAHCSRNLEKCKVCGDMVARKYAEEHFLSTHAPVSCSLCSETMEREILPVHRGENCPQRIVTCEYCEFPLPAIHLFEHQEVCGNRTELCHLCNRYIRLATRAAERERGAQRRPPPHEFSRRRLLFTIAITGIAVLLGSLFFQRKTENNHVH